MSTAPNEEKKATAIAIPVGERGIRARDYNELWQMAVAAARSGLIPKGVSTPEQAFIAMQMGAELGLSPLASVQRIAVINGRPSLWGDGMLAVCQASPVFDHDAFEEHIEGEGDNRVAVCRCRRTGAQRVTEKRYSVADAKKAGLWGKQGPWQQYPDRMLQMRARSFALRDTFADLLCGLYTAEEVQDMPPRQVEVKVTAPAPAAPTSRAAALAADVAAPSEPPPEVVAQVEALRAAEAEEPPPSDNDNRHALCSEVRMLVAGASKAGVSRIRKEFNLVLFDDDGLAGLDIVDLFQLRDALKGEQTEAA